MNHKILFPTGHQVEDFANDNLDIHVVLSTGEVYVGTLFTIQNIKLLMERDSEPSYFWASDMVIVKDLHMDTIELAVLEIVKEEYLETVFTNIGAIPDIYGPEATFDNLKS